MSGTLTVASINGLKNIVVGTLPDDSGPSIAQCANKLVFVSGTDIYAIGVENGSITNYKWNSSASPPTWAALSSLSV